jgi:peptide/nickel transport system substrate-binding protein
MKKILMFFILLGIIIGIVKGLKIQNSINENEQISLEKETEERITELSLPISDIDTLNPLKTKKIHVSDVLKLVYDPLFSYDEENQIIPVLTEQWMQRDELTWIIRIKENVLWHDGKNFTAYDIKHTMDLLMQEEFDSIYKANVKNVSSINVIDNKTFSITLIEPDSYFISKLTFPIISANHIYDDSNMMGTGAYKYFNENDSIIMLAFNENWWKKENVNLKTIYLKKYDTYNEAIKAFKSSEIDMIITNMYDWKEKFGFIGINAYQYENKEYELLIPNCENKILGDSSVRKAILHGINRANIVSDVYDENAEISDLPIMSNSKYAETSTEYNPEMAKQILINGGWNFNGESWEKDGVKLKLTLQVCDEDLEKILVAEKIENDLKEIGININIKKMAWNDLMNLLENNKFELVLTAIDVKDEYQFQKLTKIGSVYNYANFINVQIDEIITELENSESEAYEEKMEELKELYINELPYIGLYFKLDFILTNKSVKGEYKSTVYEPFRNLTNFYK